ncbi:MAG: helix-turn-helix domain-containing protein [Streptomyces sp.]|uniref:helix-turn-helix domain-containing protein n=1 Tax=Streptomyces sp. TaxID=1931 RepID=UPI003451AE07|nr:helix-turn-helix domain-containing protein [Streptomyces sp.]
MVHTDLAPAQVADRLGFTSATVFTKFFRRCTGETPSAFRVRARNRRAPRGPVIRPAGGRPPAAVCQPRPVRS